MERTEAGSFQRSKHSSQVPEIRGSRLNGRSGAYEVTSQDSELLDRAAQVPSERSVRSAG